MEENKKTNPIEEEVLNEVNGGISLKDTLNQRAMERGRGKG